MNINRLKDIEFKQFMVSKLGNTQKLKFKSDFEYIDKNGKFILFEYENSSRGMSMNYLRILRILTKMSIGDITLIFIRTDHHIAKHKNDYENMKCVHEYILQKIPSFHVEVYESAEFIENFNTILNDKIKSPV